MFKDYAFEGKTIVVTGGGTGLGKAMPKYFSELAANVVITSKKIYVFKKLQMKFKLKPGMKYFLTFPVIEQIRGN
jgi:short-subunit dehydrogenase involved in D-alanine esterification of teichoic acids